MQTQSRMKENLVHCLAFVTLLLFSMIVSEACKNDTASASIDRITGTTIIAEESLSVGLDMKGTRVKIEGESIETSTNSLGKWTIFNPPHRTFTIAVSHPGYGTNKFAVTDYNGSEVPNINLPLFHEPTYVVDTVEIAIDSEAISVYGSPSFEPPYRHWYFLYFGKRPPISTDPTSWIGNVGTIHVIEDETGFEATASRSVLLAGGMKANDTVHVAVYSGASTYSGYFSQSAGKFVVSTGISIVPKRTTFVLP